MKSISFLKVAKALFLIHVTNMTCAHPPTQAITDSQSQNLKTHGVYDEDIEQ
jgi:hypothetical protein